MKPKRAIKEHEKALKKDPENVNIRIKLAAALHEAGRTEEAEQMYLSVARAYGEKGRAAQAIAVCKSVLEIAPQNSEARDLIKALQAAGAAVEDASSAVVVEETGNRPSGRFSRPLLTPTPLPKPVALHEIAEETEAGQGRATGRTPGGGRVEFRAPPPLAPEPGEDTQRRERLATQGAFPHKTVAAKISFRKPDRPRRAPRNRAAEAAAALEKELEVETMGRAISPRLPQALAEIASGMHLKQFPRGEMILREGDPGNALYLIVSGRVRVLKSDPKNRGGDLIELAQLGEGEIFGEFAILADFRRHATVQAVDDCHIYEIPRQLLGDLNKAYPEMASHLEGFYRDRLLTSLLTTSSFFEVLPEEARESVLKRFKPMRAEAEKFLVTEGGFPGAFYIVLLGSVDVVKATGPQTAQVVATLTEGDHFGAVELLRGEVATVSVMARGPMEVAMMPAKDFYEVVAAHPVLWDALRTESIEREHLFDELLAASPQ